MKYFKRNFLLLSAIFFLFVNLEISAQGDTTKVRMLINSAQDKTKPFTEVIKISNEAIELSEKINYPQGKADALNGRGRAFLKLGEYPDALESFWNELSLREKNSDWKNSSISNTYAYIGESYRAIGNFDLSQEYLGKGFSIAQKDGNEKELAFIYNRYAAVYHELSYRRPDSSFSFKAIEYANKSLDLYKKFNNSEYIISNYNIIGAAYNFQGLYDESLKTLFIALELSDKDSTYTDRANILINIASVYNFKQEYDKAIQYGLLSNQISRKFGINVYIIGSLRELAIAYSKKGDYETAFKYIEEGGNLYIKVFDEKKTAEIYGLQKKHEANLKQQEDSAKTIRLKIIGLAGILIIFLISTGIYIRHRKGITLNKELSERNKLIFEQKEELTRTNAAKDKFISILSHDIRNPLNGILGFADVLDTEYDTISEEEKKEYIGYLKSSSESLYKLIDRVLMWSRLQRGTFKTVTERINIKEIADTAVGLQKANAIKKGIILENNIKENLFSEADKNILDTVLRNLVDNAVKFTNAGGKVNVYSKVKEKSVIINVSDTGVGIEKTELDKLFKVDSTASTKGTAEEEGSGLGLTLCKEMLELMETKLEIESEKDKGSRFYFELPLIQ